MIDAIAVFTTGYCAPSGSVDSVAIASTGYCVSAAAAPAVLPAGGVDESPRAARQRFARRARQQAQAVQAVLHIVARINDDN